MQHEVKLPVTQRRYAEAIDGLLEVTAKLPQVSLGLVHLFSKGYYARVLKIPADTLVVAKLHKTQHFYSLVSGEMQLHNGDEVQELHAPCSGLSRIGDQRVGYAVTPCVFMTVHKTDKTDLEAIEAEVIAKSQEELCLGQ